ncbi:DUF2628 domain-containing protein [Clostridium perfringens]|uniref:DUF2628 domain-containing protein n=1 Tax=Clostridium perfringens TaxID=1502 RepID=UPI001F5A953E|nr:DUF2628 domain-containing protein [Clostridium perfringens]MCI2779612.1 DUF2628 domain-containing protein [Clostridium perfringens]
MNIRLKNDIGMVKECKVGFSWTILLFGFFPPFFRGDWKWGLIQLVLAFFTGGLSNLVFCFIYNKIYINSLLQKGFKPAADIDRDILVNKGFLVMN